MIDDVTARRVAPSITEPLLAQITHNHTIRLVYPTILAGIIRQLLAIVKLLIVLLELQFAQSRCRRRQDFVVVCFVRNAVQLQQTIEWKQRDLEHNVFS